MATVHRLALACVLLLVSIGSSAGPIDTQTQILKKEREAVEQTARENREARQAQQRRIKALRPSRVSPTMIRRAELETEQARIRHETAQVDLQAARSQWREAEAAVAELERRIEQQPSSGVRDDKIPTGGLENALAKQRQLSELQRRRVDVREAAVAAAGEAFKLKRQWLETLQTLHRAALEQTKQSALDELQTRMESEQQRWLTRAGDWRRRLQALDRDGDPDNRRPLLHARVNEAEERARLALERVRFAQVQAKLDALASLGGDRSAPMAALPPDELQSWHKQASDVAAELADMRSLLRKRLEVLQQQTDLAAKRDAAGESGPWSEEKQVHQRLRRVLAVHLKGVEALIAEAAPWPERLRSAHERSARAGLTAHRPLPADTGGWRALRDDLTRLPITLSNGLLEAVEEMRRSLATFPADRWVLLAMAAGGWLLLLRRLANPIPRTAVHDPANRLLRLVHRSRKGLAAFGLLSIVYGFAAPREPAATLLAALLLWWGGAAVAIKVARALLGPTPEARFTRVYRQWVWMISMVATLALVATAAHTLDFSAPLRNLLDRLFLLSLLLFTVPALEARRMALQSLASRGGERYWLRATALISLLAPLSGLAAASIGVAGYVNLAKAIGAGLALVLTILAAWLVLSRMLRAGADTLKNWVNLHTGHGLLLTTGLIEPGHTLARTVAFVGLWWVPLKLYGIGMETPVVAAAWRALTRPLFTAGDTAVNPLGLIVAAVAVAGTVRLGRWLRLMTYRWAFAGVADEGARHSLSVFTQYAVVLTGLLTTLHLVGIDLTTLAIFAGALGVGIGFGLQNIANNFISGILLLVERPLRTTDIVKVGEHEGEVTHIGMRSITVKTWDNQEVIMPNADVISHAFTNWTHHDHIVRTVVEVRVGLETDPHRVQDVVAAVLAGNDAVLAEPAPHVWLREFGDSALLFHVQYFTDLKHSNRLDTRSEVLMAVWRALRAEGIRIPRQQVDLRWRDEDPAQPAASGHPVEHEGLRATA